MKKITSLSLGFSFLIMSYTGVVLFIAPHGRISRWLDWHFLGLDKVQYQDLHATSMITFLIFGSLHIYYNWKPILSYLRDIDKKISFTKKEFLTAFLINAVFVVGTLFLFQPFKYFLDFGEDIKQSWGERSVKITHSESINKNEAVIKPPPEQLGRKTLRNLADTGHIDLNYALNILETQGFKNVNADIRIRYIADEINSTPTDVYKLLTE